MKTVPYGSWKSPLTGARVAAAATSLGQLALDNDDLYFTESRPAEGGRVAVMRRRENGQLQELIGAKYSARSRVHEYGGGAFCAHRGLVYFTNLSDQRLYVTAIGQTPKVLTPEGKSRYADLQIDAKRERILCVREDHGRGGKEPVNELVAVALNGEISVLATGYDFYAAPRLSPDGSRLAWISWKHPNMPWDETELWMAEFGADGKLSNPMKVAGETKESVLEPLWSPGGVLHFVSDRTGWWNLYRFRKNVVEPLCPMEAEFSGPQWQFGLASYGFLSEEKIFCAYTIKGTSRIGIVEADQKVLKEINSPFTKVQHIKCGRGVVYFLGGSPRDPWSIIRWDVHHHQGGQIRSVFSVDLDAAYISEPQSIEFQTTNNLTAYGFFYPPKSKDFQGPPEEQPPLIVISHGGPTGSTVTYLSWEIQYWTTRGFGVLDVNYGGSTGYGTAYRRRLNGNWGVVDVDDCVNGAKHLVQQKLVDEKRLIIRGASAGGYTTLCALTFRDVFSAGASYFGVSDIELMAKETHKFESHYDDSLVGPYPGSAALYRERSPIHYVDRINCPIIFFHGLEDKVVPFNQAEKMFESLKAKGITVAYITFAGEDHGFRKKENIQRALESELYFYSEVFKFLLDEFIEVVPIENNRT